MRMCSSTNQECCNFSSLSCPEHIYLTQQENVFRIFLGVHVAWVKHFLMTRGKEAWETSSFHNSVHKIRKASTDLLTSKGRCSNM